MMKVVCSREINSVLAEGVDLRMRSKSSNAELLYTRYARRRGIINRYHDRLRADCFFFLSEEAFQRLVSTYRNSGVS